MRRYRLTPAATRDLSSVWDYTVEHWDVGQAETYLGEIRAAIERISENPNRGHACDEIREGYRRYAIGSRLVFYVVHHNSIDVVRILHQRMDATRHL